jgi:hypothetical protein
MKLEEFLVKAKLGAYASDGDGNQTRLEDGSKELRFEEGDFRYRDRYFGWNPFAGEEIVWSGEEAVWSMNYYGVASDDAITPGQVFVFLRKAMRHAKEDRPFRGPRSFREDDFEYLDESEGTIGRFKGIEKIRYTGREVFRLEYHGGAVANKL